MSGNVGGCFYQKMARFKAEIGPAEWRGCNATHEEQEKDSEEVKGKSYGYRLSVLLTTERLHTVNELQATRYRVYSCSSFCL